jgi:myxalamid-type polyketide synthase MxaB
MDALASHRRMQNLPALSVQWGPWDQVGLAAALTGRNRQRMAEMGLTPLDANLGLQALFALLAEQKSAISSIVDVDWKDYPIDRHRGYLDAFLQPKERSTPRNQSFLAQIKAEPDPTTQWELLTAHVIEKIHRIIGISPDMVELRTGLFDLGLDSLMAVELKTHLEKSFECSLPATISFDYPTAKALINHLGQDVVGLKPAKAEEKEAETELLAETKDELVAILEAELDSL